MSANAATPFTTSISINRLTFGNYSVWKLRIKMLLVEHDLWQANMDKSIPPSDNSFAKALALVINTIADDQLVHVNGGLRKLFYSLSKQRKLFE